MKQSRLCSTHHCTSAVTIAAWTCKARLPSTLCINNAKLSQFVSEKAWGLTAFACHCRWASTSERVLEPTLWLGLQPLIAHRDAERPWSHFAWLHQLQVVCRQEWTLKDYPSSFPHLHDMPLAGTGRSTAVLCTCLPLYVCSSIQDDSLLRGTGVHLSHAQLLCTVHLQAKLSLHAHPCPNAPVAEKRPATWYGPQRATHREHKRLKNGE